MDVLLEAILEGLVFSGVVFLVYPLSLTAIPRYRQIRTRKVEKTLASLDEQFFFVTPGEARSVHLLSTLGFLLLGGLTGLNLPPAYFVFWLAVFGIIGYQVPEIGIRYFFGRRLSRIERQIPDFLKIISGSLHAGLSISEAMKQAVKEIPAPLSQELGLVLKKIKMGESFEESFKYLEKRLNLDDIRLIVSAVILSNEAGGSLTSVFERLEKTIEERKRLKGKIVALTVQGKMQGWVVGLIPFFLGAVLFLIDPSLMVPFWTTPAGEAGLLAVFLLEITGFILIRNIVRYEV